MSPLSPSEEKMRAHRIVLDSRTKLSQQSPRPLDERSQVTTLSEGIQIPQRVKLSNLAHLGLDLLQIARLLLLIVGVSWCLHRSGRDVIEVLEEEVHKLAETILEEFGQVLRVEVVVDLEEEEKGLEEKGVLVGCERGGGEESVGLLWKSGRLA